MPEEPSFPENNWLQAYLVESIRKPLCISIHCTTCGAQAFRSGLLDAVALATGEPRTPQLDEKSARAIADALARVEAAPRWTAPRSEHDRQSCDESLPMQPELFPLIDRERTIPGQDAVDLHTYEEAVRCVIYDLWSLFRPFSYLDPILENTWAGNVLTDMQSHERYVGESRNERLAYESPKQVAERREEKRRQRRGPHEQRLALKKERDRLWRLAHPETPGPRNPA